MNNIASRAAIFYLCLGVICFAPPAAGLALAQAKKDFSNPVIAVLDVQKVMREAKAAKYIRKAVEIRSQQFDAVIGKSRAALAKEQEALRKQQSVLSREAFAKRRRQLERKYGDLKRRVDDYRRVLNTALVGSQRKLRFEIAKILAVIMKKQDINITLARTGVLVFDERLNVTKKVIAALDKNLPKIPVKFGFAK